MMTYAQRSLAFQVLHWVAAYGFAMLMRAYVPEPYMDEIFHVPQAKLYCQRIYDRWDPSITTPPGLYFLSSLLAKYSFTSCLETRGLRIHITIFNAILLPIMLNQILRLLHEPTFIPLPPRLRAKHPTNGLYGTEERRAELARVSPSFQAFSYTTIWTARTMALFPVVFFFSGLYYTDVPGLGMVLACYLFSLKGRHMLAGIFALLSLTFRQTNVIWIAWIFGTTIIRIVEPPKSPLSRQSLLGDQGGPASGEANPKEAPDAQLREIELFSELNSPSSVIKYLMRIHRMILRDPQDAMDIAKWYLPTFVAFGAFLKINGGIVLGHQEHHVAGLHFPQLLYFLAFATMMGWPALLDGGLTPSLRGILKTGLGGPWRVLASAAVLVFMNVAVKQSTIVHPFLLADNRHYFFYIWRRVYQRHLAVPYALTPGYLACGWAWAWKIGQKHSLYWMLSYLAAVTLVLVPAPLVEPRYFIIPYIILRLHTIPEFVINSIRTMVARDSLQQTGNDADSILRGGGIPPDIPPAARVVAERVMKHMAGPRLRWLYVELGWYIIINLATIGFFLGHTFEWEGWEGKMRLMW